MKRCFLACFSSSSSSKRKNPFPPNSIPITIQQPTHPNKDILLQDSIHWLSQSKTENEEDLSHNYNNKPQEEEEEEDHEECSDSLFSLSIGCRKPVSTDDNAADDTEVNSAPIQQFHPANNLSIVPFKSQQQPNDLEGKNSEEEEVKPITMNHSLIEYRYRDCTDDGYNDINLDGDDDPYNEKREVEGSEAEGSESLFSLPTDYYYDNRKRVSSTEKVDDEVSSIMVAPQPQEEESKGNNIAEDDVCSVLKPIENYVSKENVKVMKETMKKDKENINMMNKIGVDTSLSNWLDESDESNTPKSITKGCDYVNLGAWTFKEMIKYCSATSSSPVEKSLIGTVWELLESEPVFQIKHL